MNKLYIVRHGKTDWNAKGLMQGIQDIELNDDGIKDAMELSKIIDIDKIDICISSPLKRAKKTAEILTNNKLNIIYDDLLKERSYGSYEGNKADLELIYKGWQYDLNFSDKGIEPMQSCMKRAEQFINKIKTEYPDKNILIVSHAGLIKALHFNLIGYDENTDFLSFLPKNTTIYEYILK